VSVAADRVQERAGIYEVPKSTETSSARSLVSLSEAVELNPKPDRSSLTDQTLVSFVPMSAVEAESGRMDASTIRPYGEVKKGYTHFRDGDVLFAKITPCMENGKMVVAHGLHNGVGLGSTEFHVLRPREGVDSQYVYYFVSNRSFRNEAVHHMTGAVGQKRVPGAFLARCEIPLPNFEDQRRIAAEIEKQFSRLDEAVANLKRVKVNLKRYRAAVLKAAVEGQLVRTEGAWTQVELGDIAFSIRNGYSRKPDAKRGTRIFRISAVRPMELNTSDVRYLSDEIADYASFFVEAGDVLFTRYNGSRNYVGVCALVSPDLPPTVYPDKLIRVRVQHATLLPSYLVIAASTGRAREYLESKIRTTAGQSGISGGDLKALPLSIPSLTEQHRIVAEVDRRLSLAGRVEHEVEASLQRATALTQSILHKAFQANANSAWLK